MEDDRENANLILYGTATLERDLGIRRRRWMGSWRLFFPDGPISDGYVVIRFVAERVELMNFSRGVVAEPFGLRPLVLVRDGDGAWVLPDLAGPAI